MADAKLQSLIDRVIGKDGILRVPAYWMRRILGKLMEYSDKTAESQARQALTDAKTYADATSKEYTDQQIAELGITGKEPVVYVLPEGTLQKMSYPLTNGETYTYTFTDAEAAEYIEALAAGLDKVIFMVGSYEDLFVPRSVAEKAASFSENTVTLVSPMLIVGSNNDGWYTWAVGFSIDYNTNTGKVTCTRTSAKNDIDIQGMIDSSIGDINTILDNINGEEV